METKRLERWQKFPMAGDEILLLRAMLNLRDEDELPETLWIIMGIHKAMEARFIANPWSPRDLASMIIESQALLPTMKNLTEYVRGENVFLTNLNREGKYWNPGPLGMHLINCDGDVYLVKPSDIKAPKAAITDSQFNIDASYGKQVRETVKELKTEVRDIDLSVLTAKVEKGELAAARG